MDNNDSLKVRFKLHGLEFELEGKEGVVKEEFDKFKGFITQLLPNVNVQTIQSSPAKPLSIPVTTETDEIPVLKEVVKRDLPQTEPDWILIYAFYITEYGESTFTEDQIKEQYEQTGRKNLSRMKNLKTNVTSLLNKGYIKVHNDLEYRVKETGLARVQEIFQGKSNVGKTASPAVSNKRLERKKDSRTQNEPDALSKPKAKPSSGFKVLTDLNYRPKDEISLIDFFKSLPFKSNPEIVLGIVWYCKEKLKIERVTDDHIFTGLKELKVPVPPTLHQVIINTKNRNTWLTFEDMTDITYSIQGSNYIEFDLPQKLAKNGKP